MEKSTSAYAVTLTALAAILVLGFFATVPSQSAFAASAPLTANAQSVTTQFNHATQIQLNGTGPSGFAYELDSLPQHGTLTGIYQNNATTWRTASGNVTYTPSANYTGSDAFTFHTYKYSGSPAVQNVSSDATVSISVGAQPQTSGSLSYKTQAYESVNIQLVVVNGATFQVVSGPTHGSIQNFNSAAGTLTYKPADGFAGDDSFTYVTTDGINTSAVSTVHITVEGHTYRFIVASLVADKHPELNLNNIPESHSGQTRNSVQFGAHAGNLLDVLNYCDLQGWKTSDLSDGQFVYLMEHFDELSGWSTSH